MLHCVIWVSSIVVNLSLAWEKNVKAKQGYLGVFLIKASRELNAVFFVAKMENKAQKHKLKNVKHEAYD